MLQQQTLPLPSPEESLHADCSTDGTYQTAFGPLGGIGSTLHGKPVIAIAKSNFFRQSELKGRSIESMDDLLTRSLWTTRRHAYPIEERARQDAKGLMHNARDGGRDDNGARGFADDSLEKSDVTLVEVVLRRAGGSCTFVLSCRSA